MSRAYSRDHLDDVQRRTRAARSGSSSWAAGTPKKAQIAVAHVRVDDAAELLRPRRLIG